MDYSIYLSDFTSPTATQLPPVTTALPGLPGLSPGAIAGIAVGSITGLVLIVGFLLLVFFCGVVVAGMLTCLKGVSGLVLIVGFFFNVFFCEILVSQSVCGYRYAT